MGTINELQLLKMIMQIISKFDDLTNFMSIGRSLLIMGHSLTAFSGESLQ